MRPRKMILLHADETTVSLMRLPLECTVRYRVIGAETEAAALAAFTARAFDLVIYDCTEISNFRTVLRMKQIAPHVPVMLLGTAKQLGMMHGGDCMLVRPSMAELLERVKIMSARKRGPRKGSKRTVASVPAVTREAVCA